MLTLTDGAIAKVKELFAGEPAAKGKSLRVGVEPGGCSGYEYSFSFDDKKEGDAELPFADFKVLLSPQAAPFLKGSEIDYSDAAAGAGFKIENPNVKSSCGCGKSNTY